MGYKVPAIQHGFRQTGRALMVTYEVSELESPDVARIALHGEKYGWLIFDVDPDEVENLELPKLPKKSKRSDSETLRAVLFRVHANGNEKRFEDFYHEEMQKIIEHYKKKI